MLRTEESHDALVIETNEASFVRLFGAIGLALLAWAAYQMFRYPSFWRREQFGGTLAGVAVCAVALLAMYERTRFVFDGRARELRWMRKRALHETGGTIPFADITAITAPRPIGDDGAPSRRAEIVTRAGVVPLTVAFSPDLGEEKLGLAERLRAFVVVVERDALDALDANVMALLRAGSEMDAIRALREQRKIGLLEAKELVKRIRRGIL